MRFSKHFALAILAMGTDAGVGFTTYKEIREGFDNSAAIVFTDPLDRSATLFLYVQIIAGWDHVQIAQDFRTLAQNYGAHDVGVIPRVRYGDVDGNVTAEPNDSSALLGDVATWAALFAEVSSTVTIPVIQAGFLGLWGEWHDGPFCQAQGADDSSENLDVKRQVVETLRQNTGGSKVALRYPRDHHALFPGSRGVTLHNDCIFNGGPGGSDGGTFPADDRQTWVDYTKQVAGGNQYGGEACNQAGDSTYDWSNWTDVCGENGLVPYIHEFQISYMNNGNPEPFQQLFQDEEWRECTGSIQAALMQYS